MIALFDSVFRVSTKHRKTLRAVFVEPTSASLVFAGIESLLVALGGEVYEREGSRVKTYKNYIARIEFDEGDNIFVSRVLGLRSIISFHGEIVSELRREFEVVMDDFLNDCKEQSITPEKPASGKLMLRVPPETHGAALVAAQAAGKSLNQWASQVLRSAAHV